MAFIKIDKSRSTIDSGTPLVSMGAYLADGKVHQSKSIAFRVTRKLIDDLGWKIVDNKLRIAVHEGTDTDKGFLQLVPDEKGYSGSSGSKDEEGQQGISISVSVVRFKHYVLNECPVASHVVNHIVDNGSLIIECPDWFRYNLLSEPQPEPKQVPLVAAPPAPVQLHPGRGHRRRG